MNSEDPTRGNAGGSKSTPVAVAAAALRDITDTIGPQQQRQNQHQSSAFLPEPFPTAARANSKCHFHDAFGESDSGVDYGPPNEYEDGNDGEGGDEAQEIVDGQTNLLNEPPMVEGASGEVFGKEAPEQKNAGGFDSGYAAIMMNQSAEQFAATAASVEHFVGATVAVATTEERIISVQELEEEVGLHEATLESLTLKLQKLNDEIQRGGKNSSVLRKDVQLLHQRKLIFNKRTDNNLKLVKDLEVSLEKCLERLRRALDAQDDHHDTAAQMMPGDNNGTNQHDVDTSGVAVDSAVNTEGSTQVLMDQGHVPNEPSPQISAGGDETQQVVSSMMAVILEGVEEQVLDLTQHEPTSEHASSKSKYIHAKIPLNPEYQIRGGQISWTTPKLVRKIQYEAKSLPVDFPAWRTHPLSNLLLRGIDSATLISDIMNVTVLEHLLEMEDLQRKGELPKNCGWVKESTDVWGTSLDVYAQVNWKHLFSGFRRVDGSGKGVASSAAEDAAAVDPNVILCPYELGGTCADDQCPYQHLQQDDKDCRAKTMRIISSNKDESYEEGYVRYSNLPKPQLPRALSKDDFIIEKVGGNGRNAGGEATTLVVVPPTVQLLMGKNQSSNSKERDESERQLAQQHASNNGAQDAPSSSDNRLYHCPVCLDSTKTFNREELQAHLKQCNSTSLMTSSGVPVTIRHALHVPEEGNDGGASLSSSQGSDDNSAVLRDSSDEESEHYSVGAENNVDDGPPSEQLDKPEEGDDASIASEGSDNSAAIKHYSTCDTAGDHSMSLENNVDEGALMEQLPESRESCGVQENLDYVSLPSVADSIDDDSHMSHDDNNRIGDEKAIFNDMFWWQQLDLFPARGPDKIEGCGRDTFDNLLSAFGFQRLCNSGKDGIMQHSLQYTRLPSDDNGVSNQEQIIEDVLLSSRLIDLSRVCVHMGRDSFALSAISSICQSRANDDPYHVLFESASRSIKSLSHSRCCIAIFQVQVHLLLVSESLHAHYDFLCGENTAVSDGPGLDTLVDQILHLNRPEKFVEKNLLPAGFDAISQSLSSRLPSSTHKSLSEDDRNNDEWAAFVKTLRLMMDKFVVIPYFQLRTNEQLSFLMQCVCMGKFLGHMLRNYASKERTFASYLHALNPIWSSLQVLLQPSTAYDRQGYNGWLQPDIIAIVTIGPVIFACVADVIAPPGDSASSSRKLPPKFDSRAHANVSSLDNFIVGILRELNRFGRLRSNGRFNESLMTPLYALSATICVALGSFEKAHQRLSNLLVGSSARKSPSMYALSEMIWSQLVQIRMICPSYSVSLKCTDKSNRLGKPTVPDEIIGTHHEIASRVVGNGIFLWGVKLRGDSHMNIMSPCFNPMHCEEWVKAATHIFIERPRIDADGHEGERTLSEIGFHISDPYPELDGVKGRASVFPESLLLLGNTLTNLSLEKCGLTRLPFSIGHHLSNLQSLNLSNNLLCELPSSICFMVCLEVLNISYNHLEIFPKLSDCSNLRVIDVSHNQLTSFPADLALQCHNLQSFLVDGNPASDIFPPPQKRQKVG